MLVIVPEKHYGLSKTAYRTANGISKNNAIATEISCKASYLTGGCTIAAGKFCRTIENQFLLSRVATIAETKTG